MCADCPTSCGGDASCHGSSGMESKPDERAVCPGGCGLPLPAEGAGGAARHCCVDALRAAADALEERSAALEHEARMATLRWNRREQSLLARVTALQHGAQLAAIQHQRRLHQYRLHIHSIAQQLVAYCKRDQRDAERQEAAETPAKELEILR